LWLESSTVAAVRVQLIEPEREQLHQLPSVVLVGGCAFGRIAFIVIRHVQIAAHGGIEGDGFDDVSIVSKRVVAENPPVGRIRVGVRHSRFGRNHPNLAQDESDSLPELILAGDGVLKEGGLHGGEVAVRRPRGIERGLVGQIRGVQRELPLQPVVDAHLLELYDGGGSGSPGGLIEEPGCGPVGHDQLRAARLAEPWTHRQRHQYQRVCKKVCKPFHRSLVTFTLTDILLLKPALRKKDSELFLGAKQRRETQAGHRNMA
jgi:hypothetical protein